jgi:hypothetical protein
MIRPVSARYPLVALLVLAACQPALGATDEEEQEESNARWSLALGAQVDQDSNRGFDGEIGYELTPASSVRVAANSVDYTATNPNGFHSQGLELGASHDFVRWTLEGAVGRWQDTDIVTAKELKLGGDVGIGRWTIGPRGMLRRSDFDPLTVNKTVTLRDGSRLPVSAVARCALDNTGLGLHGGYGGEVWGAYATAMSYQYRDSKCRFNAPGLQALARANRAELRQLLATHVDRLGTVATRRIGRDNVLLDSEADAGASWKHEDLIVSLDYARQKEAFNGARSNTVSATGTADLGDNNAVDVTLGLTRGGTVKTGAFVGFAVRAHF